MNKEQLIKMIELLPIEELNGFKLYYYSETEQKEYSYPSSPKKNRDEHSVSYGIDFDQLILQKIDKLKEEIRETKEGENN